MLRDDVRCIGWKADDTRCVRSGILFLLKVFLEHRGKDEVGQLVGAKTHGATPLVMACRNGHYDVAEYLIEKCGADVEQPGSGEKPFYPFDSQSSASWATAKFLYCESDIR